MAMTETTVRKSVTVEVPVEKAFRVFTDQIDAWWNRAHHIGSADVERVVLEPRVGGRWYEIGVDGSECDWGRVVEWEPPGRLVLGWQISSDWRYDPDLLTRVEVRFVAVGPDRTRVELEHRDLDRFGDAEAQMRAGFDSPGGWQGLLELFAAQAATGSGSG
jgi:uncharacterized protein YndB with AHSA1/START domain